MLGEGKINVAVFQCSNISDDESVTVAEEDVIFAGVAVVKTAGCIEALQLSAREWRGAWRPE